MTRITFTIEGVEKLRFEFDSASDEQSEDVVDEEMVTAVLQNALARIEQHAHTPLAEVKAAPRPKPMQGSGKKVPGLERVACPSCGAAVGESCFTGAGQRYYPGWGHTARIELVDPDWKRRH